MKKSGREILPDLLLANRNKFIDKYLTNTIIGYIINVYGFMPLYLNQSEKDGSEHV